MVENSSKRFSLLLRLKLISTDGLITRELQRVVLLFCLMRSCPDRQMCRRHSESTCDGARGTQALGPRRGCRPGVPSCPRPCTLDRSIDMWWIDLHRGHWRPKSQSRTPAPRSASSSFPPPSSPLLTLQVPVVLPLCAGHFPGPHSVPDDHSDSSPEDFHRWPRFRVYTYLFKWYCALFDAQKVTVLSLALPEGC